MQEIELIGIDEKIYYEKVNNMMPIYIWENKKVNGVFSALCVKYGSINQEFKLPGDNKFISVPKGIAHFLEHLNFYEKDGTTATDFYSKYGSEVNAFTTFDYTCYHVYSILEYTENLNHLLDFVLTPYFTKKMVNKERKIIIEELKMDNDIPDSKIYFANYANLFHKYKYKDVITGSEEDVKNTTIDDIKLIYNTFYHPENMFLVVTGNVNPYEIEKVVKDNLNNKDYKSYNAPVLKKYKEPISVVNNYQELDGNVEIPKVKISLKTPLSAFKNIDPVELRLIISLILNNNFGPTSDLKELLMEKELINYMSANRFFIEDYLIITISLETNYPEPAIQYIKESLQNLIIDEASLKRKINSSIATLVLNYEDIVGVSNMIQEDVLSFGKVIDDVKVHLENINLKNVREVIKKIDTKNMAITVLKANNNE
jgi:predicted Zn-dependent peptidase